MRLLVNVSAYGARVPIWMYAKRSQVNGYKLAATIIIFVLFE